MPIPSTGDGYDGQADGGEAEESFKPLTRAELENRVLDGVKRKELEAQKEGSLYDIEHGKRSLDIRACRSKSRSCRLSKGEATTSYLGRGYLTGV